MRANRSSVATVCLLGLALVASGCSGGAEGNDDAPEPAVELSFAYHADGGEGFVDQTVDITNEGDAAGAPDLDYTPVDADGAALPDVTVTAAFGSDEGGLVVPAHTQVYDILRFTGPGSRQVAEVDIAVADPGTLDDDVPPANDLTVKLFDPRGRPTKNENVARLTVRNPFDAPVTVDVVGLEFAEGAADATQQFARLSPLAGPLTIEPGATVRRPVARRYLTRFFGSVQVHLAPAE